MAKHRARRNHWNSGVLQTEEFIFDSAREAMDFIYALDASIYCVLKIYDETGQLLHSRECSSGGEFYA